MINLLQYDLISQEIEIMYIFFIFREELKKCRERVKQLEDERDLVFNNIQSATDEGNM